MPNNSTRFSICTTKYTELGSSNLTRTSRTTLWLTPKKLTALQLIADTRFSNKVELLLISPPIIFLDKNLDSPELRAQIQAHSTNRPPPHQTNDSWDIQCLPVL